MAQRARPAGCGRDSPRTRPRVTHVVALTGLEPRLHGHRNGSRCSSPSMCLRATSSSRRVVRPSNLARTSPRPSTTKIHGSDTRLGIERQEIAIGLATEDESTGRDRRATPATDAVGCLVLPGDLVRLAVNRGERPAHRRADRRRLRPADVALPEHELVTVAPKRAGAHGATRPRAPCGRIHSARHPACQAPTCGG